jgi:carboxypeptidase C (cathepsin A)
MRLLIYNGDADACVPYKGNEEWIDGLVAQGVLAAKDEWRPWYTTTKADKKPPAGYVTTYTVAGAPSVDFSFVTIRLAGHMVPTFQPAASLAFFTRFLAAEPM